LYDNISLEALLALIQSSIIFYSLFLTVIWWIQYLQYPFHSTEHFYTGTLTTLAMNCFDSALHGGSLWIH